MNRAFIFVNGINTFPGCSKNWNGRAVTFVHSRFPNELWKAEKVEYFCGVIGRAFGQRNRAKKLFRTLSFYRDFDERIVVAHSNGCDVVLDMMQQHHGWPHVTHLHLLCGATNADFQENGLNSLLLVGRVKRVSVYVAGRDMMVRLAHTWPGQLLGFDGTVGLHHKDATLGLSGPVRVLPELEDRVRLVNGGVWATYGHSDCWDDTNFPGTMGNFLVA